MDKILIFGDSICYGKWDKEGGWVTRLRKYIDENLNIAKNKNIQVFNLGIPSELVINTAKRFEKELLSRINTNEQNLVIIACGVNDSCPNNRTTDKLTQANDFKQAFVDIISLAKKYNCKLVIIGLLPVNPSKSKSLKFTNALAKEYDNYITEITTKSDITKIDLFEDLEKLDFSSLLVDAVHPNSDGHKILYERILGFLQGKNYL